MEQIIAQGAESKIYFLNYFDKPAVRKERFVKTYRNPLLDERLTKERIKAEIHAINHLKNKCEELSPLLVTIYFVGDRDIITSRVFGKTLHNVLQNDVDNEFKLSLFKKLGKTIALIHKCEIIHGDLTTCNFLIDLQDNIVPIDFGLSFFSTSAEDRAVDLYVLERSLLTTNLDSKSYFELLLKAYYNEIGCKNSSIAKKLEEVRSRGRKRLVA